MNPSQPTLPDGGPLSSEERAAFLRDGFLVQRGVLSPDQVRRLQLWTEVVEGWAEDHRPGMHHFEQTAHGPRLARSEDIVPHHPGLAAFMQEGRLLQTVSGFFGEPAVLFKEKINHKQPGGAGFAPHQDAPAYRFVDHHISCMVPVDAATVETGCLWVARGHTRGVLPMKDGQHGVLADDVAEALAWEPVELQPGDLLWFDSYAPHKSGTNTGAQPRRAFYLTYNAASRGDHRARYYADKRAEFAAHDGTFGGERVRISVNDDFLGKPAEAPPQRRRRDLAELERRYAGTEAQQLYDEDITELAHALQCAELAAAEGASASLIAAALLHDVGHLLIGDYFPIDAPLPRDFRHEDVGARYLARYFGPEVVEPVALHVAAKRYLTAVEPDYFATLSASSVRSLEAQGGPMSAEELAAFRSRPHFEAAVKVRLWDDLGKDATARPRPFSAWMPLLRELAAR
jgi:predicted HD phosphohydrolase